MAAKKKPSVHAPASAKATAAPKPSDAIPPPPDSGGLTIVGVVASAGGLDAFKKLFDAMPADSGIAFVLIPHLDPKHESLMVELLSRHTRMPVVEAREGMAVEANQVYILPPNKYMTISGGALHLTGPVDRAGMQTSIDLFLRSLADDRQERAIGIVLSGTGSHGTLGLKAVKAAGGMAMVQDPATAEYPRMPQSAIATGLADYVLPVEEMPKALVRYVQHFQGSRSAEDIKGTDHLEEVLKLLRTRTKFDFQCYRKKMLMRRIDRRMGLSHFHHLAEYLAHLRTHPDEIKRLARDLLISVTSFFRDPESLEALARDAIVPLVAKKGNEGTLRVWVAGCATGEEVYSLAILLLEELARGQKKCQLLLFATDVDEEALAIARQGIYPDTISSEVSPERLARFFTKVDESSYQINKSVREAVVFAQQNLIGDAPFSKLDLVSCRNVLIYLEPEVQKKVISLMHFALNEGGYLLLGPSETVGRQTDLFEPINKKWRIFRRLGARRTDRMDFPITTGASTAFRALQVPEPAVARPQHLGELAQRLVLEELAPAAVLVNRKFEILYIVGPMTRYLDVPTGEPTKDLLMLVRDGLRSKLRDAIGQAVEGKAPILLTNVQVRRSGGWASVNVTIKPVTAKNEEAGLMLVLFQDAPAAPAETVPQQGAEQSNGADGEAKKSAAEARLANLNSLVQQLEYELRVTKEDLQTSLEEMQSSNEELRASNEEAMSMNEEMQSANEELECGKEELQSLNEELSTVNNQLQDKVEELEEANNDLANLLNCSDIATLFLDRGLYIRRFTAPASQLFNIINSDIGRPLSDITVKFTDPDLHTDAVQVLHQLKLREKEVAAENGRWYLRRIVPYRTLESHVEGVVITFTEITQIKQAAEQARYLATVLLDSGDAILVHDLDGRIKAWNRGAEQMYEYPAAEALQMNMIQFIPDGWKANYYAVEDRLQRGERIDSYETQRLTKSGRVVDVWVSATALTDGAGRMIAVAKTERDITERKQTQAELEREVERRTAALMATDSRLRAILNLPNDAIITFDPAGLIESVNPAAERMLGHAAVELIGQNVLLLMPSLHSDQNGKLPLPTGDLGSLEVEVRRKDGTTFSGEFAVSEVEQLKLVTGVLRDITRRKELEYEVVKIAALEQERIGQNLHDQCGQELTALGLFAETLASSLAERSPIDVEMAHKLGNMAKGVLRQLRNIAKGLALSEVEADGLPDALQELVSRLCETSGIHCGLQVDPDVQLDNGLLATHLYHIAQEACTNILKYANAKNIEIRLHTRDNKLILEIRDDGLGIPADTKAGLGLRIMRNRANVIGASLAIESAQPQGTTVTCTLAYERPHGRKQNGKSGGESPGH